MDRVARWVGLALVVLAAGLVLAPTARAASFDCAKASNPTERTVCADPEISRLDDQVAAAYRAARELWPGGGWVIYIRNEQRQWLKERNACKADLVCLKRDYEQRLDFLTHASLKWMGRYVAGRCPDSGVYLDVTPSYPEAGIAVALYICPNPAGNMLLQAQGVVDASGRLTFNDAGCPRTLTFTDDVATLSGPKTARCALGTNERVFWRDPGKSPYLTE